MIEQLSMLPPLQKGEDVGDLYRQVAEFEKHIKLKRRWENAFQRWSNKQSEDGTEPYGCCGTGGLCDWCEDNSYGRPCVRALNAMCREKRIALDYTDYNFKDIWWMNGLKEGTE